MVFRIEPYSSNGKGVEWVRVADGNSVRHFKVTHADFKHACCEAFGLVDPDANADDPESGSQWSEEELKILRDKKSIPIDISEMMYNWMSTYAPKRFACSRRAFPYAHKTYASDVLSAASRRLA